MESSVNERCAALLLKNGYFDELLFHFVMDIIHVAMAWKNNGCPYISIASDELKSLLKL